MMSSLRPFRKLPVAAACAAALASGGGAASAEPAGAELLPPNAKPGECYTRVFVPATYATSTEQVLAREATSRIEIVPTRYEVVEERVLVKEASQRLEVVPATYDWVEERVLVKEASKRVENVPASYEWVEEQVLVKPAHTTWKKGEGPIQRVDHATGEIMCLVEVPAEYKTVKKRIQKAPPTTRTIEIPAEYKTVKKRVQKAPPTTRTIEIPAEYKTMKVRKMVSPPQEKVVEIPAQYETVTRRTLSREGAMEWREILCQTNVRPGTVTAIQRALKQQGHEPGPIDGVIGRETLAAVSSFQRAKGLPEGGLTMGTLEALGVEVGR